MLRTMLYDCNEDGYWSCFSDPTTDSTTNNAFIVWEDDVEVDIYYRFTDGGRANAQENLQISANPKDVGRMMEVFKIY